MRTRSRTRLVVPASLALALPLAAQSDWTQVNNANPSPSARSEHAMAYDAVRGTTVLFGGLAQTGQPQALGDTWIWDGTSWRQDHGIGPADRFGHAMAFDIVHQQVVLFGGTNGSPLFNDTWLYDGTSWSQVTPTTSPGPRENPAMAYDTARQRVVMFGGAAGRLGPNSETWEWDGTDWQLMSPTTTPPARILHSMVYDIRNERVLMFGGSGRVAIDNTTWVWDGQDWTAVPANANGPVSRTRPGLAYDYLRERVVLYGGADDMGNDLADTWDWDGVTWVLRAPLTVPPARSGHAMVYDFARRQCFMFGGAGLGVSTNVWLYGTNAPGDYAPLGAGCAGSSGTPNLSASSNGVPWVDTTFSQTVLNVPASNLGAVQLGLSSSLWNGTPLPIDLSVLGMTGCSMYVSGDALLPLVPQNGQATFDLVVPNLPSLVGQSIHDQALLVDPGANPLGLTVSNGASLTFGAL